MSFTRNESTDEWIETVDAEIRALVPNYLRRRRDEVEKLKSLLRDGDYTGIKEIGHNLKGTGFGFGFQVLSDLGEKLESAARMKVSDDTREIIAQLETVVHGLIGQA
jgi:HPt (histidine-containing phosphotransfer) domain-containing protein